MKWVAWGHGGCWGHEGMGTQTWEHASSSWGSRRESRIKNKKIFHNTHASWGENIKYSKPDLARFWVNEFPRTHYLYISIPDSPANETYITHAYSYWEHGKWNSSVFNLNFPQPVAVVPVNEFLFEPCLTDTWAGLRSSAFVLLSGWTSWQHEVKPNWGHMWCSLWADMSSPASHWLSHPVLQSW